MRRWLDARPITARADSAAYRLRKFVHRHRFGVAASVVVVLALLAGLGAALWQARIAQAEARRADSERDKAELQLARSERVKEFILALLGEQDPLSRASATARSPTGHDSRRHQHRRCQPCWRSRLAGTIVQGSRRDPGQSR
ncbi:MAG: hypothetical protein IPH43_16095 [Xanthomonadales bacterium]|nr:hypothetical protein [Xanthomonadales bacterium]